jgi:MFS transporter, DHA1 family, inner membrane transport protein
MVPRMTQPAAHRPPRRVLPVIVLAQLLGVSPWFAVNAVMPELRSAYGWPEQSVGTLSAALTLGFVGGTLAFALLGVADRFRARNVFLGCALAAAACTLLSASVAESFNALLFWRLATGFFLAGIYPVGMKIAALWFPQGLGAALGWLVGALVLGSAAPHALRAAGVNWEWQSVFVAIALLAALAGVLLRLGVPEPPAHATPPRPHLAALAGSLATLWTDGRVRASAFGYFGHMWELYTLWVLLPAILATRLADSVAVSWSAFLVLGAGAIGCIGGGLLVRSWGGASGVQAGGARVAGVQLALSGACCLAAPSMLDAEVPVFMGWLLLWGITVAGDSPQFSALTASNAPREAVGSVLTLTNSIGFAISMVSIEIFVRAAAASSLAQVLPWLALGPAVGLLALRPLWFGPGSARPAR